MTERIIARTAKWKVTLKETAIEVDLYDLVYSEVLSILDAYKKAVDMRHFDKTQKFRMKHGRIG